MTVPREWHNHEGTENGREEEHIMTKHIQHVKPPTHEQKRTATEEPPLNGQQNNKKKKKKKKKKPAGLKPVLPAQHLALILV